MKNIRKRILRSALLGAACFVTINVNAVEEWHQEQVTLIVNSFKNNDTDAIVNLIRYPLPRKSPIPSIDSKEEMRQQLNLVFDKELFVKIANSNINSDWESMGSRGIMLGNGAVWLNDEGLIIAVNHQSQAEIDLTSKINKSVRKQVHSSLKNFKKPEILWQTEKFLVRVDDLGGDVYRYASWSLPAEISDKPDLILTGRKEYSGSAGNHEHIFKKGKYEYKCVIRYVSHTSALPMALEVHKKDKLILNQAVVTKVY